MPNAHREAATPPPAPAGPDGILEALHYLRQCIAEARPVAVLNGPPGATAAALERLFAGRPAARLARVTAAEPDPRVFLEAVLAAFGFEPFDSTVAELDNLLRVFLRHQAAQGRRTVLVIERAHAAAPPVLERLRGLAEALAAPGGRGSTLVLAGEPRLERILDAPRMAAVAPLTRRRHRIAAAAATSRPRPAGAAELVVTLDGHVVQRHRLRPGRLLLGRHEDNDLAIVSRFVSRHHALFVNREDGAYIVDLNSTNGTSVNGVSITQHALQDGDVVSIGNFRIQYLGPGAAPADADGGDTVGTADTVVMRSARGIGRAPAVERTGTD